MLSAVSRVNEEKNKKNKIKEEKKTEEVAYVLVTRYTVITIAWTVYSRTYLHFH